jgi:mannose/cellobiose epimerase-like protein (N-acyl-D-glucosamine 2-epimerase family)
MNKSEQAAFVAAYCDNVGNAPDHIVEAFVADYENGDDVSEYSEHATSIMDALGMWHAGVHFQLSKSLRELK